MLVWPKIVEHYKTKKLFSYIEMGKEILTLGNIEIKKINLTATRQIFWEMQILKKY